MTKASRQFNQRLTPIAGLLAVVLLTLWGGWMRFASLGSAPFWIDEGFSVVHAQAIQEHGYPLLPSGEVSWNYVPAHYLMALGLSLFRDLHVGARFFPALAGTALIPAVYALAQAAFRSRLCAVAGASLAALLSYSIAWSRQARMYSLLQLFSVAAIASTFRMLRSGRRRDAVLTAACLLLAVLTHRAGYLAVAVALAAVACHAARSPEWRAAARRNRAALGLATAALLAGFLLFQGRDATSNLAAGLRQLLTQGGQSYAAFYLRFLGERLGPVWPWCAGGALLALARAAPAGAPLCLGLCAYFAAIATRTRLFHLRYVLPMIPFLCVLAGYAAGSLAQSLARLGGARRRLLAPAAVAAFLGCLAAAPVRWTPAERYELGRTEPQPDWRGAYRWIREHHDAHRADEPTIDTVSTFPMFHDLYLGRDTGTKYFLPFNMSGLSTDVRTSCRYSVATPLPSLASLKRVRAYLVLDSFGLLMLADDETKRFLRGVKPDHIVTSPGPQYVFIWKGW